MFSVYIVFVIIILTKKICVRCCKVKSCRSWYQKIHDHQVMQKVPNFYSALPSSVRESLIREEVVHHNRTGTAKLRKEELQELVLKEKSEKSLRLRGDPSYRILRHKVAEDFNYICPGIEGMR